MDNSNKLSTTLASKLWENYLQYSSKCLQSHLTTLVTLSVAFEGWLDNFRHENKNVVDKTKLNSMQNARIFTMYLKMIWKIIFLKRYPIFHSSPHDYLKKFIQKTSWYMHPINKIWFSMNTCLLLSLKVGSRKRQTVMYWFSF